MPSTNFNYEEMVEYLSEEGSATASETSDQLEGSYLEHLDAFEILNVLGVVEKSEEGGYRLTNEKPKTLVDESGGSWEHIFSSYSFEEIKRDTDPIGRELENGDYEIDPGEVSELVTIEEERGNEAEGNEAGEESVGTNENVTEVIEELDLNL